MPREGQRFEKMVVTRLLTQVRLMPREPPPKKRGKVVVLANILVLTKIVVEVAMQSRPEDPTNISVISALEVVHAPQSECEKDDAPLNMRFALVKLDTSHLEISMLNDDALLNIPPMVITLDTSHLEISPSNDDAE